MHGHVVASRRRVLARRAAAGSARVYMYMLWGSFPSRHTPHTTPGRMYTLNSAGCVEHAGQGVPLNLPAYASSASKKRRNSASRSSSSEGKMDPMIMMSSLKVKCSTSLSAVTGDSCPAHILHATVSRVHSLEECVGGTFSTARSNLITDNGEGSERCDDGVTCGDGMFGVTSSGVTSSGGSVGGSNLLLFSRPFPEPRLGLRTFLEPRGGVTHS